MGQVVNLDLRRAARTARRIEHAQDHPALRWYAGLEQDRAHRKDGAVAACGVFGGLTLAHRSAPLCPECFPLARAT